MPDTHYLTAGDRDCNRPPQNGDSDCNQPNKPGPTEGQRAENSNLRHDLFENRKDISRDLNANRQFGGADFNQLGMEQASGDLAQRWGLSSAATERMALLDFRPLRKNSLLGFADVQLANGLVIDDCPVCTSYGKFWAAMPSRAVLDESGRQIERAGKRVFAPVIRFADKATRDRWSTEVVALVRAAHPEALAGEALL